LPEQAWQGEPDAPGNFTFSGFRSRLRPPCQTRSRKRAMNATSKDIVEDSNDRLEQDDHMRGMEHTEMTVEKVERPFPSVARVTARIAPTDPAPWRLPNLAIRIEVEAPEGQRPISRIYTIRSF